MFKRETGLVGNGFTPWRATSTRLRTMRKTLSIKVMPNSCKDEVVEGNPVVVRVKEPPVEGRANQAVVKLLAEHFNSEVRIISGHKSKRKVIELITE